MKNIDKKALEIEALIRNYLTNKDYKDIDLVGVFFHEIMIYATNFYIISTSNEEYTQKVKFPFLNSDYVKNIPIIAFEEQAQRKKSYKFKLIELIQLFLPLKKSLLIEDNISIDLKKFILKNIFRYKFISSTNVKINLPDLLGQLDNLKRLIVDIANLLEIKNKINFVDNFIRYVESYIGSQPIECNSNALIVGSNARLNVRINSANYLSKGKKVISFCHGEHSIYVLDELAAGYTEMSYCTDCVTYGKDQDFNKLEYAKPLFKLPNVHYRNSSEIGKYYKDNSVLKTRLENTTKILYIPTSFSGNQRYAPFRDISDSVYREWQESLFKIDLDITYKAHPKNKVEPYLKKNKIEKRYLQEVLSQYDFYILDYISTASALCVATDKPILYLNIGCRNMSREALDLFKKRVFWVDIDLDSDLNIQIKAAIKNYNLSNKEFINRYSERFSLRGNNKVDTDLLNQIIKQG